MALVCLLDTSVWNGLDRARALAAEVTALLRHGEIGYSSNIERLEVLRAARNTGHHRRLSAMFATLPRIALTEAALMRAGQVQEQLVQRGHHRRVKIPGLLRPQPKQSGTGTALRPDYDLIASITGQDVACVVDQGSVS